MLGLAREGNECGCKEQQEDLGVGGRVLLLDCGDGYTSLHMDKMTEVCKTERKSQGFNDVECQ